MPKKQKLVAPKGAIVAYPGCEQCEYWNNPERQGETFCYVGGIIVYDVEKARQIVADREPEEIEVSKLAGFVDYPRVKGTMDIFKYHVNETHIDHVDPEVPVILACTPVPRKTDENQDRHLMPIDGSHRIARAVKDGKEKIKVHCLTEEETDSITEDNRPKPRSVKKTTAKKK